MKHHPGGLSAVSISTTGTACAIVMMLGIGLLATGCGGGGTKSSPPVPQAMGTPPPPPAPPPVPTAPPLPNVAEQPLLPSPAQGLSALELETFYRDHLLRDFIATSGLSGRFGFLVQFGQINLPRAYANLYISGGADAAARPGNGVTIGFIDSGLDTGHPAFDNKRMTVEYFGGASADSDLDELSHGTAVASVAAGVPRDNVAKLPTHIGDANFEGIAPGANIRMLAIPLGDPPDQIAAPTASDLPSLRVDPTPFRAALQADRGVDILNLSFGISSNIQDYSEAALRAAFSEEIAILAQAERSDNKTLLIWAAGNEHNGACVAGTPSCVNGQFDGSSPSLNAGWMARIPELQSHSVTVVALNPSAEIADFSNRCGMAADWCIAAPGEAIGIAFSGRADDGSVLRLDARTPDTAGTSFAAPMVSGGLALMKQLFRDQLSNEDLLARMFATADKTGIYADRNIYGQGLLDLGAATEPVGAPVVAAGAGLVGGAQVGADGGRFAPLSVTKIHVGGAFGDALFRAFAHEEIATFDALGAPFWYPLGSLSLQSDERQIHRRLFEFMDDLNRDDAAAVPLMPTVHLSMHSARLAQAYPVMQSMGLLSLVDAPISMQIHTPHLSALVFTTAQNTEAPMPTPARGLALAWQLPHTPLHLRMGYLSESGSAIGATATGAFDALAATSFFAGAGLAYQLGRWRLFADAELGVSYADNETGLIDDISTITTSAFSLGLGRTLGTDTDIGLFLQAPVRVESGTMRLQLPTGRTPSGRILQSRLDADLEPSGRQVDVRVQLSRAIGRSKMSLAAVASHQPGHDKDAAPHLSLFAGYRLDF